MVNFEVFINEVDYTEKLSKIESLDRLNEMSQFSLAMYDVDGASPTDIVENKVVRIKLDGTQILKGLITKISYTSSTEIQISGYGMGLKLLNRKMDRYQATNRNPTGSSPSIFTDIVSENQDGSGTDIMTLGTNTAYGAVLSFRSEYDNRLRCVAALANTLGWDWWVDQDGSDNDRINIDSFKGSSTSVFTFIDGMNCSISKKERDTETMVNWLTFLGYGDGINQLRTEFFAASPVYSTLSANCDEEELTLYCDDLSDFPAGAGYFKIGNEYVYGTKSGNNIVATATGRGIMKYGTGTVAGSVLTVSGENWRTDQFKGSILRVDGTDYPIKNNTSTTITVIGTPSTGSQAYTVRKEAFSHYKGCAVFEYDFGTAYTPQAPKTDSSIDLYGIKETQITRKDIIDLPTLELFASKYMLSRATPVERNTIIPDELEEVATSIEIGDVVTLNDDNAGFSSSEYRVVGRTFKMDMMSGIESLTYEINDKKVNFINDPADTKLNTDTLNTYMNGATNIYCVSTYENGDSATPLNLRFYIPPDAVAINHVKLSFKIKKYRAYNTANANESAHTHAVGTYGATDAGGGGEIDDETDGTSSTNLTSYYRTLSEVSMPNEHTAGAFIIVSGYLLPDSSSDYMATYWRCRADGSTIGDSYWVNSVSDTSFGNVGNTPFQLCWFYPEDTYGVDFTIEGKDLNSNGDVDVDITSYSIGQHTHTLAGASAAGSAHTHGITYGIYENSVSTPSVVVTAGVEGSETAVGTYTTDQSDLDITTNIPTAGAWYNIKFTLNQAMRIEANAYIQVFLKSV